MYVTKTWSVVLLNKKYIYSYLKCIVYDKLLKLRQTFWITLYKNVTNSVANQSQDCSKCDTAWRWEQHALSKRRIKLVFLHGVKAKRLSFERHPPWKGENLKLKNLPNEVHDT